MWARECPCLLTGRQRHLCIHMGIEIDLWSLEDLGSSEGIDLIVLWSAAMSPSGKQRWTQALSGAPPYGWSSHRPYIISSNMVITFMMTTMMRAQSSSHFSRAQQIYFTSNRSQSRSHSSAHENHFCVINIVWFLLLVHQEFIEQLNLDQEGGFWVGPLYNLYNWGEGGLQPIVPTTAVAFYCTSSIHNRLTAPARQNKTLGQLFTNIAAITEIVSKS